MKQFKVTVVHNGGKDFSFVKEIYEVEAQSEMQVYRDAIFNYETALSYVYVEDVNYPVDGSFEDRFFVIEKAHIYTAFADTDCPYAYLGKEIRVVDDIEVLLKDFEDVADAHFIRRATGSEQAQWVENMREFACK